MYDLKTIINIEQSTFDSFLATVSTVIQNSSPQTRITNVERSITALRDRQKNW